MATDLMTADTSVVVPLMMEGHEAHAEVVSAVTDVRRIPAHVMLEAVAVSTRLPGGFAIDADQAARVLRARFPEPPLVLRGAEFLDLLATIAARRLRGGQVYDALVAATAKLAGAVLLTRDRRAEATYRAVGVESRYLS